MSKEIRHHKSHQIVKNFEADALRKRPFAIKIADFLTSYFGTVGFLLVNILIYIIWVLINIGKIPGIPIFDPYPHSFLNSLVSIEAIFLTVIVLISQNRANQIDKLRQELQLQVNLYSEKETTKILEIVKKIADAKGIKIDDKEIEEMLKEIDASYIERKLEEQLGFSTKTLKL
ncbi:MAG: DUF1003 domain-containing protein [Patescibacteria group bacterium]